MSATFEIIIRVVVFFGVALYMGSGSSSLEKIAKDLGRIADRPGPKPRGEDPERPIDT
jgi:hypothetical protein